MVEKKHIGGIDPLPRGRPSAQQCTTLEPSLEVCHVPLPFGWHVGTYLGMLAKQAPLAKGAPRHNCNMLPLQPLNPPPVPHPPHHCRSHLHQSHITDHPDVHDGCGTPWWSFSCFVVLSLGPGLIITTIQIQAIGALFNFVLCTTPWRKYSRLP
jgi:hypothetical protein